MTEAVEFNAVLDTAQLTAPAPGETPELFGVTQVDPISYQNNPYNRTGDYDRIRYLGKSGIYGAGLNVGVVGMSADVKMRNSTTESFVAAGEIWCVGVMYCEKGGFEDVNCSRSYVELRLEGRHRAAIFGDVERTRTTNAGRHCSPSGRDEEDASFPTLDPCDDPMTDLVGTECGEGGGGGGTSGASTSVWAEWTCPEKVDAYVIGTTRPSVAALRTPPD